MKTENKPRRRVFPRYREFRSLETVEFFESPKEVYEERERNETLESLLCEIYAVDPKTNLPIGDIGQYMSDNTNPQIRDFISKQLMSSMDAVGKSSELSDDDLIRYQRKSGESVRDYVARMADYIKSDVQSQRQSKVETKNE